MRPSCDRTLDGSKLCSFCFANATKNVADILMANFVMSENNAMTAIAGKCAGSPLRKRSLWVGPCACPVRYRGEVRILSETRTGPRRGAVGAFTAPNPSVCRPSTSSGQALRRLLGVRSVGGLRGCAGRGRYEGALPHPEQARLRAVSRESRDSSAYRTASLVPRLGVNDQGW